MGIQGEGNQLGSREVGQGKSTGRNRMYQMSCRDLLMRRHSGLKPYKDDGIDIPFLAGGTTWTFDVVLVASDTSLVVAECRRWEGAIKQEALAAFAKKLDLLCEAQSISAAGVFFAKRSYQRGALKLAEQLGISLAAVSDEAGPSALHFHRWDRALGKRAKDAVIFAHSAPSVAAAGEPTVRTSPTK